MNLPIENIIPEQYRNNLTSAESDMLEFSVSGKFPEIDSIGMLDRMDLYEGTRNIRAELLVWLCTDNKAAEYIHPKGIVIFLANIIDAVDLSHRSVSNNILFHTCLIPEGFNFTETRIKNITLYKVRSGTINAEYLNSSGLIKMAHAQINGEMVLDRVSINRYVHIVDSIITGSLSLVGAKVDGDLLFINFTLNNCLTLSSVLVKGQIGFQGIRISNLTGFAISAEFIQANLGICFREPLHRGQECQVPINIIEGQVKFYKSEVGHIFECTSTKFVAPPSGAAIILNATVIDGNVSFNHVIIEKGSLTLEDTRINGTATFSDTRIFCVYGDRLIIQANLWLGSGLVVETYTRFRTAKIGGILLIKNCILNTNKDNTGYLYSGIDSSTLDFSNATLNMVFLSTVRLYGDISLQNSTASNISLHDVIVEKSNCISVDFREMKLNGSLQIHGLIVEGLFDLSNTAVQKNINLSNVKIQCPDTSIEAFGINVGGYVSLVDKVLCHGSIRFNNVRINNYLDLTGLEIHLPNRIIELCNGVINQLIICKLKFNNGFSLNLSQTKVSQFKDDESSWPSFGNLYIDGFEFDKLIIDTNTPVSARARRSWIQLQETYDAHPYENLAKLYKNSGNDSDLREIEIAKRIDLRKKGKLNILQKFSNLLFEELIGYGYKPGNLFMYMVILLFIGYTMFTAAESTQTITPTEKLSIGYQKYDDCINIIGDMNKCTPPYYPRFCALIFTIDVFLPIVDLRQEAYWTTKETSNYINWGKITERILVISGWIMASIGIAGITGLLKK